MPHQHKCPCAGCPRMVDDEKLMCLPHWKLVPKELGDEVWRTWRRVKRDPEAYRDARDAAVAHVNARDTSANQGSLL